MSVPIVTDIGAFGFSLLLSTNSRGGGEAKEKSP
jgi:hypothetical protein